MPKIKRRLPSNRTLAQSIAALCVLFSGQVFAQFKINAPFSGNTAPGWTITGTNNGGNNDSGILTGGYGLIADGNNTNDAVGSGWLRLTTDLNNQVSSARYTGGSFPSSQGVIVEFEYVVWSGDGADGLSFFLYDAGGTMAGASAGGGLGYCNGSGGYLGIGLDEWGNFSSASDQCPAAGGGSGFAPDRVVVRGPQANANAFIGNATVGGIDVPGATTRPAFDRARISLLPNGSGGFRVTLGIGQNGAAVTDVLTNLNFPYTAPATLRMGFSAATGGSTNIHEVRSVVTSTPADIRVTKTATGTSFARGQTVGYTVTVSNNDINLNDAGNQAPTIDAANAPDIVDTMPAALTGTTWTCTATAGSTCPAASGTGSLAIAGGYTLAPGGNLTFTITGTVSATAACGNVTNTATANFSTTDGFSDINATDNSANASFTVACADLSVTKTNTPGVNGNVDQASDTVTNGSATTYTIVVTNNGPLAANGAVLSDPAPVGVTCSTASCTASGGAICPAATGVALLNAMQGGGVAIPVFPAGGIATFLIICQVP